MCFNPLTRIRSSLTDRGERIEWRHYRGFNPLTRIRSSLTGPDEAYIERIAASFNPLTRIRSSLTMQQVEEEIPF